MSWLGTDTKHEVGLNWLIGSHPSLVDNWISHSNTYINVREYRRGNHKWTIQRNWQYMVHKTIIYVKVVSQMSCPLMHYAYDLHYTY